MTSPDTPEPDQPESRQPEPQQPEPQQAEPQQAEPQQPAPEQAPGYQPYPDPHAHQQDQPRPGTVVAAFWIAVVLPVVATVLIAASAFLMRDALPGPRGGDPAMSEVTRTAPLVLAASVVVFYAVLTALWIVFGFKLRAGRNWARVVLTVFAALWLVNGLGSVVTGGSVGTNAQGPNAGPLLVLGAVQSALAIAGMIAFLVLVWSRRSQWFFAAGR